VSEPNLEYQIWQRATKWHWQVSEVMPDVRQFLAHGVVKSPSEFVELSTELAQKHLTTLTEQTKELAALAQQVTLATAEPLRTSFTKKASSY
jgi:hypothetical protein